MARFVLSAFADEAGSSLDEQIAALVRNGIHYIEPRNVSGKPILEHTDDELSDIQAKLAEHGISVNSLGSPIGKYPITDDFAPHYELFLRALRAAELLKTSFIRMFSFYIPEGEHARYRDEVLSRMNIMLDEAERRGITLCHENESGIYGQMPGEVSDLLTSLPRLGGIFDPANYRMHGADVFEGIFATLKNLKYLHIKDAVFSEQMIVPAGEGEGRIGEIIDLVNEKTDGVVFLTLEPHLHVFDAYSGIDKHELRGKYSFSSNAEAFDFAANALRSLLKKHGYTEGANSEWTK